ncbi:MAG: MOSC domain-containing protein [Acidimicrobiales bacterium]
MLTPRFVPEEWTLTDLRSTVGSLHIRFAWIIAGNDDADGLLELAGELSALVGLTPSATAERHELELTTVRGEAILRDAAALVAPLLAPAGGPGTVAGLFRSDGGVPKLAVDEADIDHRGIVGDRQATRAHHGRVWQALCLWSREVIDELRGEGHPIGPGRAGENVTIAGLDWAALRPGVQLRIGEAVAELSSYATPCVKNAQWFLGGDFDRMGHDRDPGISRIYASVITPGAVRLGDRVMVLR